jgi:hypothetical protein
MPTNNIFLSNETLAELDEFKAQLRKEENDAVKNRNTQIAAAVKFANQYYRLRVYGTPEDIEKAIT